MKTVKHMILVIAGALAFGACNKKIEEKQVNTNAPTSVPASLILGTVLTDISGTGANGRLAATGSSEGINAWDASGRWNQYHCSNYDYYDNNIYNWTDGSYDAYLVLNDVLQMEKELANLGSPAVNPYNAIGRFVKAYYYYNLTSMFGDVPLTDALQGAVDPTPTYSKQEDVFKYVLAQLDTANANFAALIAAGDNTLSQTQDIYFNGNLTKWQKLVNAYKLRVLVSLSDKAGDATLNIPAQFSAILADPATYPVFSGQSDDLKFTYLSATYSTYPFNPTNFGSIAARFNMANAYVSAATSLNDARVFVTAEPAWALVGSDPNPAQYKYFKGASSGEPLATMYTNANAGVYSFINRQRYYSNYTGEPNVLVGFKEMCFNIAEGITRGWASGTAETWYKKGITESMSFYGIDVTQTNHTAYFLPPTANSVTQVQPYPYTFDFNAYYAQPSVALSGTPGTAIAQIVLQKYIAAFENSGYESYYNWRRAGVPTFDGGSGVGNNGVVPVRWAYPVSEQQQNRANWSAALSEQGFAQDDLNQKMWLIKP